jgi:hypothetical protein
MQAATLGFPTTTDADWPTVGRMSASRVLVSSGSDFESVVGYSRAVRVGPYIAVAGTTGPGLVDDIGGQTREALRRIAPDLLVEIEADAYLTR